MLHRNVILGNVAVLAVFGILAVIQRNLEFVFYFTVVVLLAALIARSMRAIEYPPWVLWALSVWAWAHMAGGLISVQGSVLYNLMLLPVVGEPYMILKFDQVVHAYGFFAATITMYYVIRPYIGKWGPVALPLTVFLAGLGLGAVNEVVEFLATVLIPNTNVGGYINTGVDLIANTIGASAAAVWVARNRSELPLSSTYAPNI